MTSVAPAGQLHRGDWSAAAEWDLFSVGRVLRVAANADLAARWPELSGHLIADGLHAAPARVTWAGGGASATIPAPASVSTGDLRRWLNALLHCMHLGSRTLTVHGVAMRQGARAVVLLGDHGAGKTLTGFALALDGWSALAGDALLMEVSAPAVSPRLVGGSSAFLARPASVERWFPQVPLGSHSGVLRVDLIEGGWVARTGFDGVSAIAAVLVHVDGDPRIGAGAEVEALDRHTGASLWYRASGHMLDRLLDDAGCPPLRVLETPELARARRAAARQLAELCPVTLVRGGPHAIAAAVHRLFDERSP